MNSTMLFGSFRLRSAHISVAGITKSSSYLAKLCRPFSARSDVIGIDLGTTNSRVAIMEGKNAKVIETTPSVVTFNPKGDLLVGTSNAVADPTSRVFATKRLIGRFFDDPQTQKGMDMVPYKIVRDTSGGPYASVEANGTIYSPAEIGGFVLSKLKETAEAYLGKTVSRVVITVPASFNGGQRCQTSEAAKLAGLDVQTIIDEPSAAALSYGINNNKQGGWIAIFDLGGGTFEVSIFEISDGLLMMRATRGDPFLGGGDFDKAVVEFLVSEFKRREGIDLSSDTLALGRLGEAAEKAKIRLSSTIQTDINFTAGGKHLSMTLTRSMFESLVGSLIERIKNLCRKCVADVGISIEDLDEVVLVGGMTHVPKVEQVVSELFGKSPIREVNGDEAVAMGAAIQGHILSAPKTKDYTLSLWYPPVIMVGLRSMKQKSIPWYERPTPSVTSVCGVCFKDSILDV